MATKRPQRDARSTDGAVASVLLPPDWRRRRLALGLYLGFAWAVFFVNELLGERLNGLGIRPREALGLIGIVTAPFLHAGLEHILSNSISFLILGWMVLGRGLRTFVIVTAATTLVGGAGTWLIGRGGVVHVGMSGVIFGYLGYLVARGFFERSLWTLLGSLCVGLLNAGMLLGMLPTDSEISWEGHLCGALAGVVCARLLAVPRASSSHKLVA